MRKDGEVVIGIDMKTKKFDKQIENIEGKLEEINEMLSKPKDYELTTSDIEKLELQAEKLRNQLVGIRKQKEKIESSKFDGLKSTFNDIGKSVDKITTKIVKWGLAVFGIRSAYNFIKSAINTIVSQDEQLSADVEYMKNALAYTLEPVVRAIVNLMKQLMFYAAYVIKAWTGKNLFANANKSLENATKNAKGLNKELNKTLAGFDEMNVLQDTSSKGGGDTGTILPSFDLTNIDMEVPKWIQWIADNKDIIISALTGIAVGLGLIKLGLVGITGGVIIALIVSIVALIINNWDKILGVLSKGIKWMEDSIDKVRDVFGDDVANIYAVFVDICKGLIIAFDKVVGGIKDAIGGIIKFIKGVFTGDWKMAWEGIKDIFSGIVKSIKGIFESVIISISGIAKMIVMTVGYTIRDIFKSIVNGVLNAIENIINFPIKSINSLIKVINKVPGINLGTLPTFNFPRLAKGGIISYPGAGVPIGSALGGERGIEGVIPLTDSQQMALLGEAIGKYITINASITNTMNGRVISRELQKINNESNFAFNR